jgi:AcrR family transcriptional regulator
MPRKRKQVIWDKVAALKQDGILDAAQHVFAEKGFNRTTIKDIAAHAGVADGTIYNHFENKDALLWALFDRLYENEMRAAQTVGLPDMPAGPQAAMHIRSRLEESRLELLRVLLSEMLVDETLRNQYRERVLKPIYMLAGQAKTPPNPTEADLASQVPSATVLGLIMLRLLGDPVLEKNWAQLPGLLLKILQH